MASKRPAPKPSTTSDEAKLTDEWGIYDPAKAGMPALFARLGRPVLSAAPSSARRERRRALRPERSSEGVGLAIAEARRRAGLDVEEELPLAGGNPARAMRVALRARAAVNAVGTPDAAPFTPPAPDPAPPPAAPQVIAESPVTAPLVAAPKKRATRRAAPAAAAAEGTADVSAGPDAPTRARSRKAAPRPRGRQVTPEAEATPVLSSAVLPATPAAPPSVAPSSAATAAPAVSVKPKPAVPAPSPRRPRGPVPLAAWAHAATVEPKPEPRRADKRGFWRGIFRMPAEVALVEYAHGAKIHRLLIETADDHVPDFI